MELFYSRDTWMDGVYALRNGIDEKIFTETFKMFPRFVREHKESFGEYGFDRGFWICRIIAMEEFRLTEVQPEDTEYITWIFKKPGGSIDELPGHTSLQRNIKQFLKNGGHIGSAKGILADEDFGAAKD